MSTSWIAKGSDLVGSGGESFGIVAINRGTDTVEAGTTIAVGGRSATYNGITTAGIVKVYKWNGTAWQLIQTLGGVAGGESFGHNIDLSADGSILAVVSYRSGTHGSVQAYQWNGSSYVARGAAITIAGTGISIATSQFGASMKINHTGNSIIVGAPFSDTAGLGQRVGDVCIFEWNGTNYAFKGPRINGGIVNIRWGTSVDISESGLRIIGSAFRYPDAATDIGRARIYDWNGTAWVQVGNDILGLNVDDEFGACAITKDGTSVAISAASDDINSVNPDRGYVRIFTYNSGTNTWDQKGSTIYGPFDGYGVQTPKISSDANTIAFNGIRVGTAEVYEWSVASSNWIRKGNAISVGASPAFAIEYSDMTYDGKTIILGSLTNNIARVYKYPNPPNPPTNLVATHGNQSITISFTPGDPGDSPITNYLYSTNGTTYTALNPTDASSPITITGLTNGQSYTITLKAKSSVGDSTPSDPITATPSTTPQPPTGLTLDSKGDGSLTISFTPGSNGGAAITNYSYSLNGGGFTELDPADSISPVTLSGLTNGTGYIITLKSINLNGSSATASSAITATPSTVPEPPTSLSVSNFGDGYVELSFIPGSNKGSSITNYSYSLNGGAFIELSLADSTSPITISGLTNGNKYTIILKAINANGSSSESEPIDATPSVGLHPPTNLTTTSFGDGYVQLSFTPGLDGGSPITNYSYSLNGGAFIELSPADSSSPITISGLTNGTEYTIRLKSINANGQSILASSSVTATPSTIPEPPTSLSATDGNGSATISFTPGSTGGSTITNYSYSLNGGAFIELSPADSVYPITISGLTNGLSYSVMLKAINANGTSISESSPVTVTPSTIPEPPTGLSATGGNGSATISFTSGSAEGSAITNYSYSLNGGAFIELSPADATSPITISGLTNGLSYSITLKAINANGTSTSESSPVTVTPSTVPEPPTSLLATGGNGSATISFTPGSTEGSAITNYSYSLNGGPFIELSPADSASPITIGGLTNGLSYSVMLKAVNANGTSASASSSVTVTPSTIPEPPTNLSATGGNASATISFTPGSTGGSAITNYSYSLNDGPFTELSPADSTSPITISGLTNGLSYSVMLKAINANGTSTSESSPVTVTPSTVPEPPTSLVATAGNGSISISFTPGSNGGSAIANYSYSFDGIVYTPLSPADTSSPITISGLTNGTTYTIRLKAINATTESVASLPITATPTTVPEPPTNLIGIVDDGQVILTFTEGNNNGTPIVNYSYSTDDVNYIALNPTDGISPITITGLTPQTRYTVRLKALNIYNGVSSPSEGISVYIYDSDNDDETSMTSLVSTLTSHNSNTILNNDIKSIMLTTARAQKPQSRAIVSYMFQGLQATQSTALEKIAFNYSTIDSVASISNSSDKETLKEILNVNTSNINSIITTDIIPIATNTSEKFSSLKTTLLTMIDSVENSSGILDEEVKNHAKQNAIQSILNLDESSVSKTVSFATTLATMYERPNIKNTIINAIKQDKGGQTISLLSEDLSLLKSSIPSSQKSTEFEEATSIDVKIPATRDIDLSHSITTKPTYLVLEPNVQYNFKYFGITNKTEYDATSGSLVFQNRNVQVGEVITLGTRRFKVIQLGTVTLLSLPTITIDGVEYPANEAWNSSQLTDNKRNLTQYNYQKEMIIQNPDYKPQYKSQTERLQALMGKLNNPQAFAQRRNGGDGCF
jgi:hypothetical protein